MLVLLELTVIRFCWTFNIDYAKFTLAGIIWMLGWCMVAKAALTALPPAVVGIIGIAIVCFQSLFGLVPGLLPSSWQRPAGYFLEFVYPSGLAWPPGIVILYVLVPWVGMPRDGGGSVFGQGWGPSPFTSSSAGSRRRGSRIPNLICPSCSGC
jgi:uncharacterized membrane protein